MVADLIPNFNKGAAVASRCVFEHAGCPRGHVTNSNPVYISAQVAHLEIPAIAAGVPYAANRGPGHSIRFHTGRRTPSSGRVR